MDLSGIDAGAAAGDLVSGRQQVVRAMTTAIKFLSVLDGQHWAQRFGDDDKPVDADSPPPGQ